MPKPLVSLSKPKWTRNVEKSSQGEKLGYFFGEGGPHAVWHTRFRVSLCSHVPRILSGTPRNQHPLLSSPANSCGWKIPQHLQQAHRCAGHAPRRAQGPFPKHRSKSSRGSGQGKPSGSQDVSACSITTRNWQPTRIYSLSLLLQAHPERERERRSEVQAHFVFTSVPTT